MGIACGWEKRVIRTNIMYAKWTVHIFSVSPQSRSPFSASFQTFCLTARAYLNTQKYGLFCSLFWIFRLSISLWEAGTTNFTSLNNSLLKINLVLSLIVERFVCQLSSRVAIRVIAPFWLQDIRSLHCRQPSRPLKYTYIYIYNLVSRFFSVLAQVTHSLFFA